MYLIHMYICKYKYDPDISFQYLMVILHSTMDPYGRPVIEVAYGEILFHSTETVWEMVAREELLGCRHDASPMFNIPRSTPVWAQYILFFWVFKI